MLNWYQLSFVGLVIFNLFSLPLSAHCGLILRKDWNKIYIAKRHRRLVLVNICVTIIGQLSLLAYSIEQIITESSLNTNSDHYQVTTFARYVLLHFILTPCLYLFILNTSVRIWLLYFEINKNELQLQMFWQTVIDPNLLKLQKIQLNRFEKYHKTLGNSNYLVKCVLLFTLIFFTISTLLIQFKLNLFERLLSWSLILIVLFTAGIVWYKMRHCSYDKLGIRKEILIVFEIGAVALIIGLVLIILLEHKVFSYTVYSVFFCYLLSILCPILTAVNTLLPKHLSRDRFRHRRGGRNRNKNGAKSVKNKSGICGLCKKRQKPALGIIGSSLTMAMGVKSPSGSSILFGNSWQHIVCTLFGYESFMNHLKNEFSIENLLIVSEVCWKHNKNV